MTLPLISFPTLGWGVIDWMEEYLCHGPGDVQGDDLHLDEEFCLFLCWLYRVHPRDHALAGRRLCQRGILSRPKGRAKSELAGAISCAEALGPVRFDGWDAEGDPVGKPVKYPFIRALATEEEQSGNTYDNIHYMLSEGRAASEFPIDVGLTRVFLKGPDGGEIRPSTAASASKDGGLETFSVADETHLYTSKELRGMYRTVARNTGKRREAEPWMMDTTTAWRPGEMSIAEQAADKYAHLKPEEATLKHGILYDHRQGDEPKMFGQDASLIKAMRAGYGPASEWMDFQRIVRIIRDAEDPVDEAYRYFLNRARAAASHWLSPDEIQAVLAPETIVAKGTAVALGFDGSLSDDHTALWACTADFHLFPIGIWLPPEGLEEGWEVNKAEVTEAVDWAFGQFRVLRLNGDPAWWQETLGDWAVKHGSPPIVEWWTNRDAQMATATGATRTAIRQRTVTIDPMPVLTDPQTRSGKPVAVWHLENCRTKKVRVKMEDKAEEAHVLRKERQGSPLKIDSALAMILAYRARLDEAEAFNEKPYERAAWQ